MRTLLRGRGRLPVEHGGHPLVGRLLEHDRTVGPDSNLRGSLGGLDDVEVAPVLVEPAKQGMTSGRRPRTRGRRSIRHSRRTCPRADRRSRAECGRRALSPVDQRSTRPVRLVEDVDRARSVDVERRRPDRREVAILLEARVRRPVAPTRGGDARAPDPNLSEDVRPELRRRPDPRAGACDPARSRLRPERRRSRRQTGTRRSTRSRRGSLRGRREPPLRAPAGHSTTSRRAGALGRRRVRPGERRRTRRRRRLCSGSSTRAVAQ